MLSPSLSMAFCQGLNRSTEGLSARRHKHLIQATPLSLELAASALRTGKYERDSVPGCLHHFKLIAILAFMAEGGYKIRNQEGLYFVTFKPVLSILLRT